MNLTSQAPLNRTSEILHNIVVGFIVSIVMLNLGAALGMLSGRGAFAGMLSAGIIALITSAFGGTRIQGSGTTAPMSAVTAVVVAYASDALPSEVAGVSADHFINIVLLMSAVFLVFFGILRLGRFINYVPNLVISGFMCGIALIIWVLQFENLFGVGRPAIAGPMAMNVVIAAMTIMVAFAGTHCLKKVSTKLAAFIPGTLVALVFVSVGVHLLQMPVAFLTIENNIDSLDALQGYVLAQVPTDINQRVLWLALPFAFQLAALCYIDTLLTSLIIDKMTSTKTQQNRELMVQGTTMGLVGFLGGVPGAQSTVPSVLTIKEGATMRLAGVSAGLFVLVNMVLLIDVMNHIPQAIFSGILIKVGYDVFDFKPIWAYIRTLKRRLESRQTKIIGHKEMGIVSGTALLTAFVDLVLAVGAFTAGFLFLNKIFKKKNKMKDYVPK